MTAAKPSKVAVFEREIIRRYIESEREAQGLGAKVSDPAALKTIAGLVKT